MAASVTTTGSTVAGTPYTHSVQVYIPPTCWYSAYLTGAEYAEQWGPGGPSWVANGHGGYSWERLIYPDYLTYATVEGRWYTVTCRPDAPADYVLEYLSTHPTRFVPATDPAPAADEDVDPRVLVEAARDAMQLPTGTISWNPSLQGSGATLVNWDTFVWVEGATDAVQVRAEVASGTWAEVEARMSTMHLHAENAETATCSTLGTPYVAGMQDSDCAIVFTRSTANLPVKTGQTLPTATLTATATWEATWTSSRDPVPQRLDIQNTTTTAEIPVAEVQTVVTR